MSGAAGVGDASAVADTSGQDGGVVLPATSGTLKPVRYPNRLDDVAVLGQTGPWKRSFLLRPKFAGRFLFLLYPRDLPSLETVQTRAIAFTGFNTAPEVVEVTIPGELRGHTHWEWRLVKTTFVDEPDTAEYEILDAAQHPTDGYLAGPDAARFAAEAEEDGAIIRLITDVRPEMSGEIDFKEGMATGRVRALSWSCHQPYVSENGQAAMHPDALDILKWYSGSAETFDPHRIWAMGDTAYSDGTGTLNFADQVYERTGWHNSFDLRKDLLSLYRLNYRYHWSFEPMQRLMRRFPHLAMWDDHEIRDGHGSRTTDFTPEAQAMKEIAAQAAEEYLFSWTPRLRSEASRNLNTDNHQAYVDGHTAGFVFDGRNSRRYGEDIPIPPEVPLAVSTLLGFFTGGLAGAVGGATVAALVEKEVIELYRWNNPGEVISDQQLNDFRRFCRHVQGQTAVKYLLLGNSVPFIYINDLVETLLSELALAKKDFAHEVQDDIRDSWHSPGNRRQLSALIDILRDLHIARPDIEIVNLSGDIHVANAFSAQPEGFAKPIYQVTTSPLTNRGTLSDSVVGLLSADGPLDAITSEGLFGDVRRLWQEASFQNFLEIETTDQEMRLCLRVYNRHDDQPFGSRDLTLVLQNGEASVGMA
ncbi:MAG: alkaline phosphatase D family protein [Pseudomonadota bacterium]